MRQTTTTKEEETMSKELRKLHTQEETWVTRGKIEETYTVSMQDHSEELHV